MDPFHSRAESSLHKAAAESESSQQNRLVQYIRQNPASFVLSARADLPNLTDSELEQAHRFFSKDDPRRHVYSVCSEFVHSRCPNLDSALLHNCISEYSSSRFWPFWNASDLSDAECVDDERVCDYLMELWNEDKSYRYYPSVFCETGFPRLERKLTQGNFFFFKFTLPAYESALKRPSSIALAFDRRAKAFYSVNSRIQSAEPEFQFKQIEWIPPRQIPPRLQPLLTRGEERQWKILFVLDRHIGDNLSLFTTHLKYLSKFSQFDLTLDVSMCPFFNNVQQHILRFLPENAEVNVAEVLPASRAEFDIVFDPYDWVTGAFWQKPQNDSTATSIVSALELASCQFHNKRRDILDIHMSALRRMGVVAETEPTPEFVRYRISNSERGSIRARTRNSILRGTSSSSAKIVSFFPFGLTPDRRYHPKRLQIIIERLLQDPDIHVIIAGTQWDTPEMVQAVRTDCPGVGHPCQNRLKIYVQEPLPEVLALMLASDVVVSMDSGPLHLARALRINPIALYTNKVKDSRYLTFPWLVEDDTVEPLLPDCCEHHVSPGLLLHRIQSRLS